MEKIGNFHFFSLFMLKDLLKIKKLPDIIFLLYGGNKVLNFVLCDDNLNIVKKLKEMLEILFIKNDIDAKIGFITDNPLEVISYEEEIIDVDDNYQTLSNKLSLLGTNLLAKTLPDIINHKNNRVKQNETLASYTRLITREDEKIDFSQNGRDIINKIRAFAPNPGAYFKLNDKEIKIIKATFINQSIKQTNEILITKNNFGITCKDGIIYLEIVKPFGKNEMNIKAFLNGIDKGKKYVIN